MNLYYIFQWQLDLYLTKYGNKGKACIITIHTFDEGKRLDPLEGYKVDKERLAETLKQIGFDVMIPKPLKKSETRCLTAQVLIQLYWISFILAYHSQFDIVLIMHCMF